MDLEDKTQGPPLNKGIKDRFSSDYSLVGEELIFGAGNENHVLRFPQNVF